MLGLLAAAAAFVLRSPDIAPGATIAPAYVWNKDGCTGRNLSPALEWHGVPAAAKSLALVMFDPDAPTGHGWYHWLVWDIPRSVSRSERGRAPAGAVEGQNEFGTHGYGGPCPPPGPAHRYRFTLYAVDAARLDLPVNAPWKAVMQALERHAAGQAFFEAKYGR